MREILFRGKSVYTGKWAVSVCPHGVMRSGHLCDDFILETVGQYTGMIDKNGTKIFEGDIVESQYTQKPYLVCFGPYPYTDEYEDEQEACGWYNQDINGCITAFGCPEGWATVVGNTHDNPELIGGSNDGD